MAHRVPRLVAVAPSSTIQRWGSSSVLPLSSSSMLVLRKGLANPPWNTTTSWIRTVSSLTVGAKPPMLGNGISAFPSDPLFFEYSRQQQQQQRRWKHKGAKKGNHLERLEVLAHDTTHEQAVERRHKKKEKEAARKGGKKKKHHDEAESDVEEEDDDNLEDDRGHAVSSASTTTHASPTGHQHQQQATGDIPEDLYPADEEEHPDDADTTILPDPRKLKERMMAIVTRFEASLKAIRGAEPTVELFDQVQVEAYGSRTSLQSVAQVVIVSPTLATATCFDPAVAKAVRTALAQQLQLNPTTGAEEGVIQIPLPRVSLETRQRTATALAKRAESYRQGIRQIRRRAMQVVKQGMAGKLEHISKDDAFRVQQELESVTEEAIRTLNQAAEKKHNSIMAVE